MGFAALTPTYMLYRPFAWITYLNGIVMGMAFVTQWVISMYQLWFYGRAAGEG